MIDRRYQRSQRRSVGSRGRPGKRDPRGFDCIQLHGEWRERAEEDGGGLSSRQLLCVSRLLRNRPAYESRFGTEAYEAMLADSLWGIYQMIGKLNPRLYVLSL